MFSKYWPLLVASFVHLSGDLWIPRQKIFCLFKQTNLAPTFGYPHTVGGIEALARVFDYIQNRFCFVCRCIVMEQNYLAVSSGPFWSFCDQCMVQIDYLLQVAVINSFTRFQQLIINYVAPVLQEHTAFSWCRIDLALQSMLKVVPDLSLIFPVKDS